MRWALVNSENIVENVVIWDGTGEMFQNTTNVELQENEVCSSGWIYSKNSSPRFSAPVESVEEV